MNSYKNCYNSSKKYIFISGSIGVGKSTFINELIQRFNNQNIAVIREYIDYDPEGNKKLNNFLERITPPIEFQKYIIRCYLEQLMKAKEADILIFERHPMESLIFAKNSFESKMELYSLANYIQNFCIRMNIPLQHDNQILDIWHDDTINYDSIFKNIVSGTGIVTCYLRVNLETQFYRIAIRGRESDQIYLEEENMTYLNSINKLYDRLENENFNYEKVMEI